MTFLETSNPVTLSDISDTEMRLNLNFPEEFINHYLQFNGGYPEKDKYKWPQGSTTTINTFYSIKYDGFVELDTSYKTLVLDEGYLPIGIVPFASDDAGNMFCISTRSDDFGYIYYCNNDHYNVDNKEECLTLIDKSFKNFIDNLRQ